MGHANFARIDRISALVRRELGQLVHEAVRDGLLPSVSVSDAEVTRDLAYATVYVTALSAEQGAEAVKALNEAAWEFRRELARRIEIRSVPELRFKYDDSVDRGERIDSLLRQAAPVIAVNKASKPRAAATKSGAAKKAAAKPVSAKPSTGTAAAKKPAAKKPAARKSPRSP